MSSGIGRACASAFARRGDTVVGVARHAPALQQLAAEHPGIEVETCDLMDAIERVALVERVSSSKFAVHGLVEGLRRELRGSGVHVHSVNPVPIATDYLARAADRSPQPGDPQRPKAPGFPPSWVADAVLAAVDAGRSTSRSVPRVGGLVRLARVQPIGALLDVVFGRFGRTITEQVAALVREQARGVPAR